MVAVKLIAKEVLRSYIRHFPIKINYSWFYMSPANIELIPTMLKGKYEIINTSLFRNIIKPDWTIIDVGAYIGYYTKLFSNLVGNQGTVIAFEPDPFNLKLLKKNLKYSNNVQIQPIALANKKGKGKLYVNASDSSLVSSSIRTDYVEVKVDKLDNIIKKQQVDLIKIDVQGYDFNVLKGARRVLENNPKIILHLEFWPKGLKEANVYSPDMLDFLKKAGFQIYIIGRKNIDYSNEPSRVLGIAKRDASGFIDLLCLRKNVRKK